MFTSACQTHETTQWTGPAIARWKGRHHSMSSARHVYRKRSVCSPPLSTYSTCAVDLREARFSPASVSSSLWSPVAGQLRTGTIPATDHRHGTLKDCTSAVRADAPPAGIRIRGAGFWHGVGNLSGALLPTTKTCRSCMYT